MKYNKWFALLVAAGVFAGTLQSCGKSEDQAEGTENQTEQALNEEQTDVSTASSDAPKTPHEHSISVATLKSFIPTVSGYTASGEPKTVQMKMQGYEYSVVEQEYENGEKSIQLTIADYNHITGLNAAWAMYSNLSVETNEEVTRSEKIDGYNGWVHYRKDNSQAQMGIAANDHVWVVAEGRGGATIDEVRSVIKSINIAALAKAE